MLSNSSSVCTFYELPDVAASVARPGETCSFAELAGMSSTSSGSDSNVLNEGSISMSTAGLIGKSLLVV